MLAELNLKASNGVFEKGNEVKVVYRTGARGRPYQRTARGALRATSAATLFADEKTAVSAGYRPCAPCLSKSYAEGKTAKGCSMDKRQQLLKGLDKAWCAFKESYAGLSDPELLEPGRRETSLRT
jgi:methylphosphotriester-DNA--protein-cysteine methyltransferase